MATPSDGIPPPRPVLGGGERLARDAQTSRGPGDKYHPQSLAEARQRLAPSAREIRERAQAIPQNLRGERMILEATLLPNYLAASYHPRRLRDDAGLVAIGTRTATGTLRTPHEVKENQPTKTLLLAATDSSLARLEALLRDEDIAADEKVLEDLTKLQEISLPRRARVLHSGGQTGDVEDRERDGETWEAVLHPAIDAAGNLSESVLELIINRWRALVQDHGGKLHDDYIRSVGQLTFMPVTIAAAALDALAQFNPLRVLRPMPRMRAIPSGLRSVAVQATFQPPAQSTSSERIAVFDGGAGTHPLLDPYVTHADLTTLPADPAAEQHGSLVSSAILHGHLTSGQALETPPAQVDHFRVLPRPSHVSVGEEPYWVMDRIAECIRTNNRWKIVSLSYGPDEPVDEDCEPDRFTAEIDLLAREHDITFLIAAGNLREHERRTRSPLGLDRVKAPADAVNAIGVGACDAPAPPAPKRTDYSCWGPGRPGLRLAPLGVSFGGNLTGEAFLGAAPGGAYQEACGTSYATPAAARGLATLLGELSAEHRTANVLRAFAAHYAHPPAQRELDAVGYGRLASDYRPLLECPEGTVTVLITDTLMRGLTQAYPLPYPPSGVTGRVRVRWTVSFLTPVDPTEAAEYTLSGVEVQFRPDIARYRLEPPYPGAGNARDVDAVNDKDLIAEHVAGGWRLSTNAKTRGGNAVRSEQVRRDAGMWETVVRYEDSLLAGSLNRPEIWLTYFQRAGGQLVDRADADELKVAVLMSVSAPKVPDLYERVRAQADFSVLTPLVAPVPVTVPAA
jgi:hypothetical protein